MNMQNPSHNDLHRDVGRVEGKQDAMEKRLDHIESLVTEGFKEVTSTLSSMNDRLLSIESEKKGANKVFYAIWTLIVAITSAVIGAGASGIAK